MYLTSMQWPVFLSTLVETRTQEHHCSSIVNKKREDYQCSVAMKIATGIQLRTLVNTTVALLP